ncbi:ABC transporter permease [Campylobacter concisus]|uniref:ABC transporter permease n=1 Tax=Campylobacter concisus TaxID=199 RepID=UPI0018832AFC|nr:ABC transporter permease [Campylobacter concisus]MBE9818439.1 ABC transporter permease [Campylobacter concisus]
MRKVIFFLACFVFLALVTFAFVTPFFSKFEPNFTDFMAVNLAPSSEHIFGTDILGRDNLIRVAYALKNSLLILLLAGFLTTLFSLIYAYFGTSKSRVCESLFDKGLDAFLSIPNIVFIMLFSSFSSGDLLITSFIIAICSFMQGAKVFMQNLRLNKKCDYAEQAVINGAGKFSLICFEILPNLKHLIISIFGINAINAVVMEATLGFFGVGSDANKISLGIMLNESKEALFLGSWWMVLFPGMTLFLLILATSIITSNSKNGNIKI